MLCRCQVSLVEVQASHIVQYPLRSCVCVTMLHHTLHTPSKQTNHMHHNIKYIAEVPHAGLLHSHPARMQAKINTLNSALPF